MDSPPVSPPALVLVHPLVVALVVSGAAAAASRWAPADHASSMVGLGFLGASYWLCVRGRSAAHYGLAFAGLGEDGKLESRRIVVEALTALATALALAVLVLPLFTLGFVEWYEPARSFSWAMVRTNLEAPLHDLVLGHLLVVALPEEAFFRGYLQSSLDERWGTPWRIAGADLGHGLWVSSALFALGHLAALPHPARLAVFFPSLLFGWLRARTGGVGASIWFHALCNVYSAVLSAGFGYGAR